jgi:hypothetical protein
MITVNSIIYIVTAVFDALFAFEVSRSIFKLRTKNKFYILIFIFLSTVVVLIGNKFIGEPHLRIFLCNLIIFLFSNLIFSGKTTIKLFISFLFDAIYLVGDMFVFGVVLIIFPDYYSLNAESNSNVFLFGSGAFYLYMLIFVLIFKFSSIHLSEHLQKRSLLLLISAPFTSAVVIAVQLRYLTDRQSSEFYIYLLPAMFFIALIFFILMFFKTAQQAQENARAVAVYNSQFDLFSKEYEAFTKSNQETQALKHDLARHLRVMDELVRGGDSVELKKYIDEMRVALDEKRTMYTGDTVGDILLSILVSKAKLEGINVDITTNLLCPIEISPVDLCVLISNSADNALEACARINDGDKNIWIHIKTDGIYLFYTIKNTYQGEVNKNGKRFLSSKTDSGLHGIGLQSIERIADKYFGHIYISDENGVFEIIAVLENKKLTDLT